MFQLKIIVCSTREERKGKAVADWFFNKVMGEEKEFEAELLDLKEINLPTLDEPKHPRLHQYTNEHTKKWSAKINEADAFVFVMPEYNYGMPPAMLNAIDYLFKEWNYKPAALVSYGGISGGVRSAQMSKLVLTTVKVVPLTEAISLPFFEGHIGQDAKFQSDAKIDKAYLMMMSELLKWTKALKSMRA